MCFSKAISISGEQYATLSAITHRKRIKYIKDKFFQIAKRDIVVYKHVLKTESENRFKSLVRGFIYEKRKHYYQTGKRPFGIETYTYYNTMGIRIDRGLHSFIRKPHISKYLNQVAIKCIIPKGSKYVEGSNDRVSDNLIVL